MIIIVGACVTNHLWGFT